MTDLRHTAALTTDQLQKAKAQKVAEHMEGFKPGSAQDLEEAYHQARPLLDMIADNMTGGSPEKFALIQLLNMADAEWPEEADSDDVAHPLNKTLTDEKKTTKKTGKK